VISDVAVGIWTLNAPSQIGNNVFLNVATPVSNN
jgi:hypothetical protein